MKFIAISFTLKDQPFDEIKLVLETLSLRVAATTGTTCLVHGFMPREVVVEKGFSTDVVDTLNQLFPYQLNCYNNGPQRELMAAIIKQTNGAVYAIGEVMDGVEEEVNLYKSLKLPVSMLPLGWTGDMVGGPISEGEYRVRTAFNVSGSGLVVDLKNAGAALINMINDIDLGKELNARDAASFGRLKSLAMTEVEHGVMDAVKAATI